MDLGHPLEFRGAAAVGAGWTPRRVTWQRKFSGTPSSTAGGHEGPYTSLRRRSGDRQVAFSTCVVLAKAISAQASNGQPAFPDKRGSSEGRRRRRTFQALVPRRMLSSGRKKKADVHEGRRPSSIERWQAQSLRGFECEVTLLSAFSLLSALSLFELLLLFESFDPFSSFDSFRSPSLIRISM